MDESVREPDRLPCAVCAGAGAWDEKSGAPVYAWPLPPGVQRCPYCEGQRKAPERTRWDGKDAGRPGGL